MNPFKSISRWFSSLALAFAREWQIVLHDQGVMIFFIVLPLIYPVVYTLIYNPEVVREMPIAVIDRSRSAESRKLVRDAVATPTVALYDYATDMPEAKRWLAEGKVFGILEIDRDYGRNIGRMETAHATFYAQMSLLLRYRAFASALTDVQIQDIADITKQRADMLGSAASSLSGAPISNEAHMLGDTQQGFASFIMPGILVLILQQSIVLGMCMLSGTSRERRRRNGGIDPLMLRGVSPSALAWGRTLCVSVFYIPATIYLLHIIPTVFNLPHIGSAADYMLFAVPFVLASCFFGQTMAYLSTDRESCFLIVVVSSVVFLFLTGLTWPRYAFPPLWSLLADVVPGVWGVEGFVRINSNGGTLAENATPYLWLWGLTAAYFVLSVLVMHLVDRIERRRARLAA